jgi:hypothetical protein
VAFIRLLIPTLSEAKGRDLAYQLQEIATEFGADQARSLPFAQLRVGMRRLA